MQCYKCCIILPAGAVFVSFSTVYIYNQDNINLFKSFVIAENIEQVLQPLTWCSDKWLCWHAEMQMIKKKKKLTSCKGLLPITRVQN